MKNKILSRLLMLMFLYFFSISTTDASSLGIIYPLYSYPNWYDSDSYIYDDVASAGQQVKITTIINPDNGPGGPSSPNGDYQRGLSDLSAGNVGMVGYVHTSYGKRDIEEVKSEIIKYNDSFNTANFNVTGIFFDEVSSSTDHQVMNYYRNLYDFVKNDIHSTNLDMVIFNHGTHAPSSYLDFSDVMVIFEGSYQQWTDYEPDAYVEAYPSNRFAAFIYDVPSPGDMKTSIDLAMSRHVGNVFITDDALPNPWDSLPSYWKDEVSDVAAVPLPSSALFFLTGSTFIFWFWGKKDPKVMSK